MSESETYFKSEATRLHRQIQSDHRAGALLRVRRALPKTRTMSDAEVASSFRHSNALDVIAVEQGRANWADFIRNGGNGSAPGDLKFFHVADISTEHLTGADRRNLDELRGDEATLPYVCQTPFGWILHVDHDATAGRVQERMFAIEHDLSVLFLGLFDFARGAGADYIWLDRDAPTVSTLPEGGASMLFCDECGAPMMVEDGVTYHLTEDGGTDHDMDADHVALNAEALA